MSTLAPVAPAPIARRARGSASARSSGRRAFTVRAAAADGPNRPKSPLSPKNEDPAPKKTPSFFENTQRPIWEMDIEGEFARQERRKREEEDRNKKEAASGLGFGHLAALDDPNVDLSETFKRLKSKNAAAAAAGAETRGDPTAAIGDGSVVGSAVASPSRDAFQTPSFGISRKPGTRASVSLEAIDLATTKKLKSKYDLDGWNYAPTKAEQARWQREWEKGEAIQASKNPVYAKSKFSTRQMKKLRPKDLKPTVAGRALTDSEKADRRKIADEAYVKVKQNLLLTTAGLCGSGTAGAFLVGGVPLGVSFAFGSAGALFYVKLLSSKAEAGGGGQGGPPSILVPVVLFMALNRWNTFYAEDVGIALAPIPMLLGFFTYKPASVFQAFRDILSEEEDGDGAEWIADPYGDEEEGGGGGGATAANGTAR